MDQNWEKNRGITTGSCECLENIYVDIKPATYGATSATARMSYLCQQWVATSNVKIKQSTIIQGPAPNQALDFCRITFAIFRSPIHSCQDFRLPKGTLLGATNLSADWAPASYCWGRAAWGLRQTPADLMARHSSIIRCCLLHIRLIDFCCVVVFSLKTGGGITLPSNEKDHKHH